MPIQQSLAKEKREWQDEVVYSIMIDRFNNGDAKNDSGLNTENLEDYQGGDISGIIKRLDYIKDMGFTAIMLSPLSESKKYDGTGVGNLRQVNEHFGSLQDVRKLVQEAHKKGDESDISIYRWRRRFATNGRCSKMVDARSKYRWKLFHT